MESSLRFDLSITNKKQPCELCEKLTYDSLTANVLFIDFNVTKPVCFKCMQSDTLENIYNLILAKNNIIAIKNGGGSHG
jgi:hypothetical protein